MYVDRVDGSQLHLEVLTAGNFDAIHKGSLEILERTGVFIESAEALELLRGAGARVDKGVARISADMVERALASAPRCVELADRSGRKCLSLGGNRSYYRGSCDNALILDPFTGRRRSFVSSDYRLTARVVDACPHLHSAGCAGNARDYPAEIRPQVAFKLCMQNMTKPFVAAPLNAQQMSDIFEMAAVIAGGHEQLRAAPFVVATCEPTTPLAVHRDAAEILLLSADQGLPVVWYGMPSAGTTAPCTPSAVLTLGNAENLAGLVMHQLRSPGAPFIYGMMPGMSDMRSAVWAYGSPDFALMLAAATQLAHQYGLPFYGTAGCSDALDVDIQAAAEATLFCLMGQLSGANLIHDVGLMAGNQFISPEMMVLVNELIEMVDHACARIDTGREELGLELIERVGPRGHFLDLDHTLENFRRFWHSELFLRPRLTGVERDEPAPLRERINRRTREIIEKHEVQELSPEVLRELERIEKKWTSRLQNRQQAEAARV